MGIFLPQNWESELGFSGAVFSVKYKTMKNSHATEISTENPMPSEDEENRIKINFNQVLSVQDIL